MKHFFHATLAVVVGSTSINLAARAQTAAVLTKTVRASPADSFVDTIGVNVHMGNIGSVYGNFAKLKSALLTLGVRHLRDSLSDST